MSDLKRFQVVGAGNLAFKTDQIIRLDEILTQDEGLISRRKVERMKIGDTLAALTFTFTRIQDAAAETQTEQ
jgi:hypothetical protein